MSLLLVQRLASEIRVIRYIEDRMRYIPSYHQELTDLKLNYGTLYLPHDGKAKHVTGSSAVEQFEKLGWRVEMSMTLESNRESESCGKSSPACSLTRAWFRTSQSLGRYRRRVNAEAKRVSRFTMTNRMDQTVRVTWRSSPTR